MPCLLVSRPIYSRIKSHGEDFVDRLYADTRLIYVSAQLIIGLDSRAQSLHKLDILLGSQVVVHWHGTLALSAIIDLTYHHMQRVPIALIIHGVLSCGPNLLPVVNMYSKPVFSVTPFFLALLRIVHAFSSASFLVPLDKHYLLTYRSLYSYSTLLYQHYF